MLAAILLHRMTVNTTRRNTEREITKEHELKVLQSECCRTCLNTANLRPIFCNSYDDQMSSKLKIVTSLEIKRNDGLSQKICTKCSRTINNALNFRMKCRQVEKALLRMLNTNIKKEYSNVTDTTVFLHSDINLTKVKVEFDDMRTEINQNDVKLTSLKDIKPNVYEIGQDGSVGFERTIHGDIPIEWETSTDSIQDVDINTDRSRENISKPVKVPPKTAAERQREYRERLKHRKQMKNKQTKVGASETKSATVRACRSNNIKLTEQNKNAAPRAGREPRARRPYVRLSAEGPPYSCASCGKSFLVRASYVAHARGHNHYFVCEECGKICKNKFVLQQHKRAMHGYDKIHKCARCEYSAASKESLTVHSRRHAGSRPYVCDHCGAGFYTRRTLTQHVGLHLPRTVQCPFCPKRLKSPLLLSNHKAQMHGKKYSFPCPRCHNGYKDLKSVRRHLLKVHGVPREEQPKIEKLLL